MLIESISLVNLTSCCAERLRDITVNVLHMSGTPVFSLELLNPSTTEGFSAANPGSLNIDFTALNGGTPVKSQTVLVTRTRDTVGPINPRAINCPAGGSRSLLHCLPPSLPLVYRNSKFTFGGYGET